jgi:hypothetical protein
MLSSLKRLTAITGVSCAIVGVGPVALASAATPSPTGTSGLPWLTLPAWPGSSCSATQGLFPGLLNLGPTGPLGPLGPDGPLGHTNNNLPCGSAVFNLGPSGPLGPGGLLGPAGPLGTGNGQP